MTDPSSQAIPSLRTFEMPNPSEGNPPVTSVKHHGVLVIVGANGSGKSRLGAWLENSSSLELAPNLTVTAHRISAQRVLDMPEGVGRSSLQDARAEFSRGGNSPTVYRTRAAGHPVVGQMNDFNLMMIRLFAEQSEAAGKYMTLGRDTGGSPGAPPETSLQKIKVIWESIFTERELIVGNHQIQARIKGRGEAYGASQLSDGERVGFYLIGEALLAEHDTIVIDEPELHVHESIQSALWDSIEAARPNRTFVYITHDLTFAASRVDAPKIVLYDYDPARTSSPWTWNLVPAGTGLPEDVVLRIAGSRRPTIFTEGVRGSLDEEIYGALYPHCHVVPSESTTAVIHSVGTFKAHAGLHRYEVHGLIDRDDRNDDEVTHLAGKGVHVLPVAGAENLLLLHEALLAIADHLNLSEEERNVCLEKAKKASIKRLEGLRDKTVALRAQHAIERRLSKIPWKGTDKQELLNAVQKAQEEANPED